MNFTRHFAMTQIFQISHHISTKKTAAERTKIAPKSRQCLWTFPLGTVQGMSKIGACAMTTKFLDNKICTFKILLSWRLPRKTAFLATFPLCPQAPPPLKSANFIFIVVSPAPTRIDVTSAKEKRRNKKQESKHPPPKKSHVTKFLGGHKWLWTGKSHFSNRALAKAISEAPKCY